MSTKAAGHGSQPKPKHKFAGRAQTMWGAHTPNPREPERAPGSLQLWLFCSLQPCCGGAAASEEGQAPHTEPPSLLAKAVQLGRYKRPEAGIFISFLMSCMNAIQAELSQCLLNTCQGRCSASGHSARATAVGRMSGRACCLLVFREKLWKREQGSSPISLCLLTSTIRAGPL